MKKMKNAGAKQKYGELLSIVPQPLLDALVQEEVVPFVGAGFSKNCNGPDGFSMPDWRDLGKRVADTMPDYAYDGNPIEALSVYEYKNQRSALVELLRKICRISEISPGETHRLLCSCFPRMICTTNFDFLIEDALNEMHIGRRVVTSEDGLSLSSRDVATVVKMHGDFDHPKRMVVTEKNYDLFIPDNPLLCTFISNLFITKTVLLVGYSLDDCDLRQLLQIVKSRLGAMARSVYCIQVGATQEEIARYKRRGVDVVNIPNRRGVDYRGRITEFLRQLKKYKDGDGAEKLTGSAEEIREQLIQPEGESRLCFVSAKGSRIAALKQLIEPVIRDCDAVPLWPENVISEGVSFRTVIAAAIRKSAVRIFDITEPSSWVQFELGLSLADGGKNTIVVSDGRIVAPMDMSMGIQILHYSGDMDCADDEMANQTFKCELTKQIQYLLPPVDCSYALSEARRLFEARAYDATVVTVWIELEKRVRKTCDTMSLKGRSISSILIEQCGGGQEVSHIVCELRNLRNKIVHGMTSIGEKEAERALHDAERLINKLPS